MIAHGSRTRSGITLTEILIAILIMGVGLISLATLFPLGLIRLREATRNSRAGLLFEDAADDMDARALLYKPSFHQTWYGVNNRDPFVQDVASDFLTTNNIIGPYSVYPAPNNSIPILQNGLPICYDPLWRAITGISPYKAIYDTNNLDYSPGVYDRGWDEARFGDGVLKGVQPYLRNDPGDGGVPSAYGLQRLSNFLPWSGAKNTTLYSFTSTNFSLNLNAQPPDVTGDIFTSIDDIVFNPVDGNANTPSSVLPDMNLGSGPQVDYKYTWFFTGHQLDRGFNGAQFIGEIVVCDGRPFGFDPLPGNGPTAPAGETVVEAIYGFAGQSVVPLTGNANYGYAPSDRTVLIRWPSAMADPTVRAGGWICDVTYERNVNTYGTRATNSLSPFTRCNWYQISKRTDPDVDPDPTLTVPYRRMILTLNSPVKTKTLLKAGSGTPVHMNVALIMPSVINVFPRSFEVH